MLGYTPRKIFAFYNLAMRRHRRRMLSDLAVARVAAHGEKKHVEELHKALEE